MNRFASLLRRTDKQPGSYASATDPGIKLYDVTAFFTEINLGALEVIRWAPAWMTRAERLMLFSLIFALRPARYLEIGTFQGGSALIVAAAMDAVQSESRMICVDPEPKIDPKHWACLQHRVTLLRGRSPGILSQASQEAAGNFDFVLIDGDHTGEGVLRDARGVLPYVCDGAYLLFHDCFYPEITRALDDFSRQHAPHVVDFRSLTREVTMPEKEGAKPVQWGGLRMMQVRHGAP